MSNPASNQNASTPTPTPSTTFNYAAAAAKSKQQQQQASSQQASPAVTPSDGVSRVATPNGAPSARNSAVSMPKQVALGNAARQAQAGGAGDAPQDASSKINFGSVHDSNAALSSSPAVQPNTGEHLQGEQPALFGSVEAPKDSATSKQKVVGFPGKPDGAAAATPAQRSPVDFHKMFQTGGGPKKANNTPATSAAPATAQAPAAPVPSASANALRPPQSGAAAGSQPFEPQRTPSATFHPSTPSMRAPSGAGPQAQQQQQRSPHPGAAAAPHGAPMHAGMPPMGQHPHAHGHPQWQGQPMYYSPMGYGYQYPHQPQPWHPGPQQQQQQQQDQGTPRSPRHAPQQGANNNGASPLPQYGAPGNNTNSSGAPSVASPASSRAQVAPYSPSTAHTSVSSPQQPHPGHHHPGHHLGMGHPSGPRPGGFHQASGSYSGGAPGGHAPSHSFGGPGMVNPMSPGARHFEPSPNPKRGSSAIRIVNPDTKATVDIKPSANAGAAKQPTASTVGSPAPGSSSPAPTSTPAQAASGTASPKPAAPAQATPVASPAPAASATASPAPSATPVTPAKKGISTQQSFQAQVQARIAETAAKRAEAEKAAQAQESAQKQQEADAEAEKKRAADAEAAKKREEEEKAAAAKKAAEEEAARKEAERKEQEAKAAAEAQEKAAREKDAAEAAAAEKQKAAEEEARKQESQKADEAVDSKVSQDAAIQETASTDAAAAAGPASKSVADIERMAREVSSVPSTPLDTGVTRMPLFPTTPRTPGTPGFGAGLPAKPMSSVNNSNAAATAGTTLAGSTPAPVAANGTGSNFTLDGAQLESRRRPSQLDTAAAQRVPSTAAATATQSSTDTPVSAASASLGSARFIDDINKVTYPDSVQSPRKELNQSAQPGKFRYDRDFLLQFMGVYSEKPQDMPALASIGMEQGQMGGGRTGSGSRRASGIPPGGSSGRGGPGGLGLGLGGGSGFGRGAGAGGMGQFSHPAKTSEERFAQSAAGGRGPPGGAFGSSGPMGSFAGGRTQPLSRGGSGSGALPSRDMMGTGTPAGGRTQSRRGRTREPGGGRGGERVNPPEKGGPTIPMDQVVPLAHSDNRWQAGSGQKLSTDSPELIQRKVKALLNKLTIEKFASISDQILEWANKSTEETDGSTLRLVIALIFEKATDEAAWSEMYAQLCRKLMELVSNDVRDESIKTNDGQTVTGGALFRKYLLTRCQVDFERGWAHRDAMVDAAKGKEAEDKAKKASNEKAEADAKEATERGDKTQEKEAELMSEEYYAAQKAKRRGLGLVRFVGELYKLQMLTERIMHTCIKKLLQNTKDPEEEEIESLCKLLTTVGAQLDEGRGKQYMDVYILRIQEMNQSEAVNSRMKFMLLDVIELRAAGWKGKQTVTGPKSIAQIHEDAAKQKQQAEAELAARTSSGRGMPPSRGGSRRGQARDFAGGNGPMGHDGWTAVGGGNAPPPPRPSRAGDMSGFGKIERSGSGRPLSLGMGPNNVFAKKQQKSSEDGSKPPSRTSSSANMFEMLGQAEADQAAQSQQSGGAGPSTGERPKLKLAPRTKPYPGSTAEEEEDGDGEGEGDNDAEADTETELTEEEATRKIDNDIKEFLEIRDINEGSLAMESLPTSYRSTFIGKLIETVLNKKEDDVRTVGRLLTKIHSSSLMDDSSFEDSFKKAGIEMLDDISIDVPSVYKFMAVLVVASGLSEDKVDTLADTIEGEGIKSPKVKFLEKVKEERERGE